MIVMYDMEDNFVEMFGNYKQCAEYLKTSEGVIRSYICRSKKGIRDKKRFNGKWYRLFKIKEA